MEYIAINAEKREANGKKAAKQARKEGKIPAVLYGKKDTHTFNTDKKAVKDIVYTPDFKVANIELEGETHKAILKDIQFHPVTEEILHIDFLKLYDGVKVKVDIPLHLEGTSLGQKNGGVLMSLLRNIHVKTVPEYLVNELSVDISELDLGKTLRVRDIAHDEHLEILNPPGTPIATVKVPRVLLTEEAAEEDEEEEMEGEEEAAETTEA
jgi:large subunit ribosomal protein L25